MGMENGMNNFHQEASAYEEAKVTFGNFLDSKDATLAQKVKALEELADSVLNEPNSREFEETLTRLKFQQPELYAAYEAIGKETKEAA